MFYLPWRFFEAALRIFPPGLGSSVGGREPGGVEGVFVRLRLLINNLFVLWCAITSANEN